jgi:hypothetical protein
MKGVLPTRTTHDVIRYEIRAILPNYPDFQEHFPVCAEHLRMFCEVWPTEVRIILISPNGLTDAEQLARTSLCERLIGRFAQPVLRQTSIDDESRYFGSTDKGFRRLPADESDRLERAFVASAAQM